MNNPSPTLPEPIRPVRVKRHRINWEASDLDLAEITAQRAVTLAPQIATGSWYLNPGYTASSPTPTKEFFQTVLTLRSTWLRTCRQIMGNSGQRRHARQAESQGRRGALLDFNLNVSEGVLAPRPPLPISLSGLPGEQRREVIEAGQIAKGLGFGGLLFIDGNPIPPRTWQSIADGLLNL
jgi:hypothetical protein